jgi:uncharacterized Zn-binding protein involved in type VI secretion
MPKVARGDSVDTVTTNHDCVAETNTDGMSGNVFVNGTGVHRKDDLTIAHPIGAPGCPNHTSGITIGSTTVFANSLGIARIGDLYHDGEEVKTGSDTVFSG